MSTDDVVIFPEHCQQHGDKALHYWVDPAGEGYAPGFVVTVRYTKGKRTCLDTRHFPVKPREVRDVAGRRIPKRIP